MSDSDLRAKVKDALDRSLSSRGYDDYPADYDIYEEGLDDFTEAVMAVFREEQGNG